MKKFVLMLLVLAFLAGCDHRTGSGSLVTQTRNVGSFDALKVSGGFEVEVRIGSPAKVVIEADDNVIEDIRAKVNNGQLEISVEDGISFNDVEMKVSITTDQLSRISSSASANIVVVGEMKSNETVKLKASSGSSIQASVDAPATEADASSGAEITVRGKTRSFAAESSSGATVQASDLLSENTKAQASSGASTNVHASVGLDAQASSGGSVSYRGEAAVVTKASSGGSISKSN